jgi:PAS domain S-box-containing protein
MATILAPHEELKLNWLTLSFPADLEKAFLDDYFRRSLRQVRIAMLLAIFFYSVFGILDAWLVPTVKEKLWFIRYAVFLPSVLFVFLLSFTSQYKKYMQLSIASIIVVAGLGIIAMIAIAPYPGNYSYYAGLILVFIFGYTFFKMRFIWATVAGWLIVIGYEIEAIWMSQTPFAILINNNFFFLAGNFLGMVACYSIELYVRKDFIQARLLVEEQEKVKAANLDLERRVDERTVQLVEANRDLLKEVGERKRAEEALRESEQKFRSLSENSPEIIYTLAHNGAFSYVNPACEKVLGYKPDEVVGKYFVDFAATEDARTYIGLFKKIRDGKVTLNDVQGTLIHKDGSPHLFSLSGAPNLDGAGNVKGMVGLLKDITEQGKLQAQLLQAQKMEAVGTLAGGIAHDFNNLLQAVHGYADLLLLQKSEGDPEFKELNEIRKASERASELSKQLLTFSRKVESKLKAVDLNQEVMEVHKLLKRTIPKMIEIELHLSGNLKTVNADPAQMEQVMMNLAVNAKDAMPEGGKLIIETENIKLHEDYCKTHFEAKAGECVLLTFSDTGHGIEKESIENIFEPFYTTKEIGKGTGLGLAMVYGIVKNHGGHIACYSEPGKGTVFKIYLPALECEPECEKKDEVGVPRGGTETILMVDDEEYIRQLGQEILSQFGYTVLTAPDAESALDLYRRCARDVDLIILDLIMPGMGGKRCMEEILKMNPEAKVVIASGYSIHGPTKEALEAGASGFISKPYAISQMLSAVRHGLEGFSRQA